MLLLDLPSDVFFDIVDTWIDQLLFVTFTMFDCAVRDDLAQRELLHKHYLFIQSTGSSKVESFCFDIRGFYCDKLKLNSILVSVPFSESLVFVVRELDCRYSNSSQQLAFINSCPTLKSLLLGNSIADISLYILNSLTKIVFGSSDVSSDSLDSLVTFYKIIASNCRKLCQFVYGGFVFPKVPEVVHFLSHEIVRHNTDLVHLEIHSDADILDVIQQSCPLLEYFHLTPFDNEMLFNLPRVNHFITALRKLTYCAIDDWVLIDTVNRNYVAINDVSRHTDEDIQQFIEARREASGWYLGSHIYPSNLSFYAARYDAASLSHALPCPCISTLTNIFKQCTNLTSIVMTTKNPQALSDVMKLAPSTLIRLKLLETKITLSCIVDILSVCQTLDNFTIYYVIEETPLDIASLTKLKSILDDYPIDCFVSITLTNVNKSIDYRYSKFRGSNVDNYMIHLE